MTESTAQEPMGVAPAVGTTPEQAEPLPDTGTVTQEPMAAAPTTETTTPESTTESAAGTTTPEPGEAAPAVGTTAEELEEIRDVTRALLTEHCTEADVRHLAETPTGWDPEVWKLLADIGITGLIIPEEYGGAGMGPVELEALCEETGAFLLPSPLVSSSVLAASLLIHCAWREARERLLPGIADGTTIAAAAITGPKGTWDADGVAVEARTTAGRTALEGTACFVTWGHVADVVLVAARTEQDVGIFEVEAGTPGMTCIDLPTHDATTRLSRLDLHDVPATPVGPTGTWQGVGRALDTAVLATAGEQVGGARHILEATVDYARTRYQFGRAIGSFQAVKHMAADLLLETESATSAARHAAARMAAGAPDAAGALALAAFTCAEAFTTVAGGAVQLHGGIAFTWEHPAHLYLRRARCLAQLFGGPSVYRERYLTALGG